MLGVWVELEDVGGGERSRKQLVSSAQAHPVRGRLSIGSPVGSAVAGRTAGETIEAATPHRTRHLRIVKVGAGDDPVRQDRLDSASESRS